MTSITLKAFRPEVPRRLDRLLDPNQASVARNCKLTAGRIDPLLAPLINTVLPDPVRSMARYRVFRNDAWVENWLTWAYPVDFIMSPLSNDQEGRFYFCGDSIEPRMSNYAAAIDAAAPYPAAWYALGVAAPATAVGVAVAGGSGAVEARAYVYTYVTALGEESGPSPVSTLVTGFTNGTWNLSGMQVAPPNVGIVTAATALPTSGRVEVTLDTVFGIEQYSTLTFSGVVGMTDLNGSWRLMSVNPLTKKVQVVLETAQTYASGGAWTRNAPHNLVGMTKRIYRTNGDAGSYFFVAGGIAVAVTTYADTKLGSALGEVLPTLDTLVPPGNLTSMVSLPNGCMAGIAGNELCLSDPYVPYSWPIGNRYSFSGNGVALVAMGNSVMVMTDDFPILFVGSDPSAMSPTTMQTYAPCITKHGVVDVGGGCIYPSYDGLWLVSPSQAANITKKLYRVEDWRRLNPGSFRAEFFDGKYIASRSNGVVRDLFILDVDEPDGVVVSSVDADSLYRSDQDGELFLSKGNTIYKWDSDTERPLISEWVSATVQMPKPINFAVAQVYADFGKPVESPVSSNAANQALILADQYGGSINDDEVLLREVNGSSITAVIDGAKRVQFTLYCDDVAVFSKEVDSTMPFTLPAGFLYETFKLGITTGVGVYSASIATSTAELRKTS